MTKRSANAEPNTLDLIILLSIPVLTALVTAAVWYLGAQAGPLSS